MDQRGAQEPREGGEVLHDPIRDGHSVSVSQHRAWHKYISGSYGQIETLPLYRCRN